MPHTLHPPLRDAQLEPPIAYCSHCGQEIYPGENLYRNAGGPPSWQLLCPDCFRLWVNRWLATSPCSLARTLGVSVTRLSDPR